MAGSAEQTSSPSKRQPQAREPVQSSSPVKGGRNMGSEREGSRAQGVNPSEAGNGGGPAESGSPVKFGRPLPGMASPSSFAQGSTTLNAPQQRSSDPNPPSPAQPREASSSQPALSMRPDEAHQQLSQPMASSGLSKIRAPGNDFSQSKEQPPSGDSNSLPSSSSSSIGQQSQAAPGSETTSSLPAARQGSPAKMRLGQSQLGASAFSSKQLPGDGAPSSEDSPATIKAKHPDAAVSQGPHKGSFSQKSQVHSSAAEFQARNDSPGAESETVASSSGVPAQQGNEALNAQDNKSFKDAHLAIERAATSGQGSIAEAASQRAKPPITRSACYTCCGQQVTKGISSISKAQRLETMNKA